MSAPYRIVFANEKGGTGKSTTAVHVAIALAYRAVMARIKTRPVVVLPQPLSPTSPSVSPWRT